MSKKNNETNKQLKIRKKRRRRRWLFALEIVLIAVLFCCLFVVSKMNKIQTEELDFDNIVVNPEVAENETLHGYTTLAVVGIDKKSDIKQGNSDTIIIVNINNDTKKVKLVSVYRDTYLRIGEDENNNGIYRKANAAYASGGKEQFISMLNSNMDLNIQDFVSVDFAAVSEVVDLLGGIDMELKEEEIVHLNNYCIEVSEVTGKDYDPIPEISGTYHLNGVQAVSYARIRYTVGQDFRRAARQREVIYKIVEKVKTASIGKLNKIVDKVFPMVYTSLSKSDILSMGMSMLSYEIEDQAGFPFDHLWGQNVSDAMDGYDCVIPVTLESNVTKLHHFLYGEENYQPSEKVCAYSDYIIEKSGFGDESRLAISEDGSLESYRDDPNNP